MYVITFGTLLPDYLKILEHSLRELSAAKMEVSLVIWKDGFMYFAIIFWLIYPRVLSVVVVVR